MIRKRATQTDRSFFCLQTKSPSSIEGLCHHMVRPNGFEPSARSLGNCCSIHLSYGRVQNHCTKSHSRCKDWLIFPFVYFLICRLAQTLPTVTVSVSTHNTAHIARSVTKTRSYARPCFGSEEALVCVLLHLQEPSIRHRKREKVFIKERTCADIDRTDNSTRKVFF